MNLFEYVQKHAIRGDCKCGKCIDGTDDPQQPSGHTADLVLFEVSKTEGADADAFLGLVEFEFPQWLDGSERGYIQIGADIGDQGLGLMTMGLGALLGVWDLITPKMLGVSDELAMQMAGMGMVSVQCVTSS